MRIKILKTTKASKDNTGTAVFEYKAGEVYDIYEELANVFIDNEWGIDEEIETQEIVKEIETQDFPKKKKKNDSN
jgi:hypothetical protein